ncbi:hypothetical protein [Yersinia ruckeri]|uniref:hypothetical protein n=1 Tax=Yersinia ruckeri TaxID=29486 RepID=UPI0008FE4684|nr:hypothetical protein [Yersinia ruckeri]EKN4690778.1 hypothetical protein [Yersinia ruckeri]ELI6452672.1 hypothetical protein [Yersinia ruckeri]MCK8583312.1 hypothetical protein [Yersinia ruckeri]MCW6525581.1 hypothetical protein [Yersinia ruckeri]MCW6560394.1 hypothetical protein [Yersinia ruckeri]
MFLRSIGFFKGFFNSCNMIVKTTSLLISRVMAIKVAAILIFPLIFIAKFLINETNNKVARCTANVTITRAGSGLSAKVKIDLSMSNENGIFYIDGYVYNNDTYHGEISRRVFFNVNMVNGEMLLTSRSNWKAEIDNVDMSSLSGTLFSDFYIKPNNSIVLSLTKNKKGYYYLSTKTMPIIYCAKK